MRLKTRIKKMENEISKQERYIEELLVSVSSNDVSPHSTIYNSRAPTGQSLVPMLKR